MIDMNEWVAVGLGLLGVVVAAPRGGRLLRIYLRHRAQVEGERERSARSLARAEGLAQLVAQPYAKVRLEERDSDGERLIVIGDPGASGETAIR